MLIRQILKIVFLSTVVFLVSCKTGDESYIEISDLKGELLATVTDVDRLNSVLAAWSNKAPVNVKQTPEFEYQITFHQPTGKSQWKYSKSGFVMEVADKQGQVYKLNPEKVNPLLN